MESTRRDDSNAFYRSEVLQPIFRASDDQLSASSSSGSKRPRQQQQDQLPRAKSRYHWQPPAVYLPQESQSDRPAQQSRLFYPHEGSDEDESLEERGERDDEVYEESNADEFETEFNGEFDHSYDQDFDDEFEENVPNQFSAPSTSSSIHSSASGMVQCNDNPSDTMAKDVSKVRARLRNFLCMHPNCGKSFADNAHLRDHMFVHTGEKKLKCERCGKRFARLSSLRSHYRVHTGEKPFACPEPNCLKKLSSRSALNHHIHIHSGRKDFKCDICQKDFRTGEGLKIHKLVHLPEKPYKCNSCDGSFNTKPSLEKHILRIHQGIDPDACGRAKCQKMYLKIKEQKELIAELKQQIQKLKEDQMPPEKIRKIREAKERKDLANSLEPIEAPLQFLMEKPFQCMVESCGSTFSNFSQLDFHAKHHVGVKKSVIKGDQKSLPIGPKYCPVEGCEFSKVFGKPMKSLQIVKRHWLRLHQNDRPFTCTDCPHSESQKSFKTKDNLAAHQKECRKKKQKE